MKDGICRLLFCEERIFRSLELLFHTYTPPFLFNYSESQPNRY
nr:MAG TPA: hypothetical protein [Caudoviricetes sp.]